MKKILAIVLAAAMLLSMTACGAAAKKDTYVVGICQLVQHDALDAATKGFQDALTEALGDKVSFEVQNASGESVNCTTIINGFVSSKVDLIMANATPALQAAASFWAPPSPTTPPLWKSRTGPAPWAATFPAPPTWRLWISRLP